VVPSVVCIHGMMAPLCLAAPSGQPPKPAGSRRRREGLTAKARAERQSSDNGCLAGAPPRQAEIRQERELVDLLLLSSSIFQSGSPSDRRDVGVAFDALDPREPPIEPMRHSPHQLISGRARAQTKVPSCNIARAERGSKEDGTHL